MNVGAIESFRAEMGRFSLVFDGQLFSDSRLHRFKAAGDRERNSWYVLRDGSLTASGVFGCWKRGFTENWYDERKGKLSQAEWADVIRGWQEAEKERERAEVGAREKARRTAAWILERSKPATSHVYLTAKAVHSHGDLRTWRHMLVVPLRDANGNLHSLQFISADGTKRFLTGGRISACSFTVANHTDGPLVICEGYSTAASVHEATGFAVVCAMNCGNLKPVAEQLRKRWPNREIIIAADNDAWTDSNPGLSTATAAAKTIGAKLALPRFQDTSSRPTDFNDLCRTQGLETVKKQIADAETPKETDDETLARLAALAPMEYERCRETEAERLGIKRVSILDEIVKARRPKKAANGLQGSAVNLPDVEPWPDSVKGAEVLSEIAETFERYLVLPASAADVLTLWTAHSRVFKAFLCSPRLNISSAEKGCGKTTARDVVAVFAKRPLLTENLSVAVLFRLVEEQAPTILADEYDAWLRDNEELRGLLNAGHRRGAAVFRCVGESNDVRGFAAYSPAVLCGIGALPGTLHDRSIVIRLERAKLGELRARFDSRHTEREQVLCRKLAKWCEDNFARLEAADPALPEGVFNRLADNWRPLFAVAEVAGGDWPQRAASAFAKLTHQHDMDAQGLGIMLLSDIRQAFIEASSERMFSKALVKALCDMTDRPWPEVRKGDKPISEPWLARQLGRHQIRPKTLRIGEDRAKGYEFSDFAEAFERFLPFSSRDTVPKPVNTGGNGTFEAVTSPNDVTDRKPHETPANIELSRCHASKTPKEGNSTEIPENALPI